MEIRSPKTPQEFEEYYDLRWRILRAPFDEPRGKEKDNLENASIHMMIYDEGKVKERYGGLEPNRLVDFRALKGDPSDNIPGILGIGEKTAIPLIAEFGSIENLYRELAEETERTKKMKPALRRNLLDNKESAFLSRALSEIDQNVPIDFDLEKCHWGN